MFRPAFELGSRAPAADVNDAQPREVSRSPTARPSGAPWRPRRELQSAEEENVEDSRGDDEDDIDDVAGEDPVRNDVPLKEDGDGDDTEDDEVVGIVCDDINVKRKQEEVVIRDGAAAPSCRIRRVGGGGGPCNDHDDDDDDDEDEDDDDDDDDTGSNIETSRKRSKKLEFKLKLGKERP